jgi:phasin family protein
MYLETTNRFSPRNGSTGMALIFDATCELYDGMERVVELNLQTVKTSLSEQHALALATLSSQSLHEMIDLQSQQLPATVKKNLAYWRHVGDIAAQTQSGLVGLVQGHAEDILAAFAKFADVASDNASVVGQRLIAGNALVAEPAASVGTVQSEIVDSAGNALRQA